MKKFIKSVVLFAVFAGLFYGFAILVSGKLLPKRLVGNVLIENKISANDLANKRFGDVKKNDSIDLAIFGSSHAYRGYDVRLFNSSGFNSYNFGSSSQPIVLTEVIYKDYINTLKAKTIIIDIYPVILSNTGGEGEINILPLFYNDYTFVKNTFKTFDVRVMNSLIYFSVFGDTNTVQSKRSNNEKYINGGYISSFKIAIDSKKYEPKRLKIDEKNIAALRNIVADAEKKGIKVFLFQAPLPEARYKSYTNNKEIDSLMQSVGKYYNYNEVKFLPLECFMDDSHINQKGVDVYNKWVIEKINE
jgi:hypothetical protein